MVLRTRGGTQHRSRSTHTPGPAAHATPTIGIIRCFGPPNPESVARVRRDATRPLRTSAPFKRSDLFSIIRCSQFFCQQPGVGRRCLLFTPPFTLQHPLTPECPHVLSHAICLASSTKPHSVPPHPALPHCVLPHSTTRLILPHNMPNTVHPLHLSIPTRPHPTLLHPACHTPATPNLTPPHPAPRPVSPSWLHPCRGE